MKVITHEWSKVITKPKDRKRHAQVFNRTFDTIMRGIKSFGEKK